MIPKPDCWIAEYDADWDDVAATLTPAPGLEGGYLIAQNDDVANAVRGGVQSAWLKRAGDSGWSPARSGQVTIDGVRHSVRDGAWAASNGTEYPWYWVCRDRERIETEAATEAMASSWDSLRADRRWHDARLGLRPHRTGEATWALSWFEQDADLAWAAGHPVSQAMRIADTTGDRTVVADMVRACDAAEAMYGPGESPARSWAWQSSPRFASSEIASRASGLIAKARARDGVV